MFSWFDNVYHFVVFLFPCFLITTAHFSIPNSIATSWICISIVWIRVTYSVPFFVYRLMQFLYKNVFFSFELVNVLSPMYFLCMKFGDIIVIRKSSSERESPWNMPLWMYIFIIKGFLTIVFIFIVISTTFRPIYHPAFFRFLSNSGTNTELWTKPFIESTGDACSDSVSPNRVQVLSIPVLLLVCSQDWISHFKIIISLEA